MLSVSIVVSEGWYSQMSFLIFQENRQNYISGGIFQQIRSSQAFIFQLFTDLGPLGETLRATKSQHKVTLNYSLKRIPERQSSVS